MAITKTKNVFIVMTFFITFFANIYVMAQTDCNNLNLDGVDDYVELNSLATKLAGSTNFTIEFWMKANKDNQTSSIRTSLFSVNPITNNGNGLLIILGGTNSKEGKLMIYDEGTFGVNADFKSIQVIGDTVCHHIAYVRNGSTGLIYIDGVNVGSHNTNYSIQGTDLFSIGQEWDNTITNGTTSQFYNGNIDDLRIWNTSRSQVQIQLNMNNELFGNETNLLTYYNFNQGISNGNNFGNMVLIDRTSNGFDGNLLGFGLNGSVSNWIESTCTNPVCNNSFQCDLTSNFSVNSLCSGDSTFFTDLSTDSNANIINWQWYFGDGDSIIGVQNPSHLYNSPGNYDVKLLVTNDLNCIDSITISLKINPVFSSIQNQTICEGDSTLFGGIYYDSTGIYADNLQTVIGCDSLLVFDLIVNPAYQINQTQTICQGDSILIGGLFQNVTGVYVDSLESVSGCDSILSTTLTLDSIPDVIASDDINVISCSSAKLSVSGASTYTWTPSTGLSCTTCDNPFVSAKTSITYVVNGLINGCSSKDTVNITVEGEADLIIPNVFSPNNDGFNDGFNLSGGCIDAVDKKIFNRWGELLFYSQQIDEVWNGRSTSGEEVSDGTYFYVFDVMHFQGGKEVLKTYRGIVSLFR